MKILANNKKVSHEYFILDTYECGIVLKGTEIKSIRLGKIAISDAYARVKEFELYILNMHISKYEYGNIFNHEETRERKLLMKKHDIIKLGQKIKSDGLTLIPTKVYLKEGFCKLELALCKGKKLYDKRESNKEADTTRRLEKITKEYRT
ncbi:MAG: SsrA-binding protein SmpB [Candidatus Izemoplasmatales bacterium]|nr:SsrA-binding protein SmpB [Candidatus Izemoplasmatales bacterium]